jgi:hypothetical protein
VVVDLVVVTIGLTNMEWEKNWVSLSSIQSSNLAVAVSRVGDSEKRSFSSDK